MKPIVSCGVFSGCLFLAGCVTPQYTVRPTPVPEESAEIREVEGAISAHQAREFERQGARPIRAGERLFGFDVQRVVERLSRVTERSYLNYRVLLVQDQDPNAAALADGRTYITTGMLNYLASRGSNESELAFILAHELAHTAAQHLVKRLRQLRQQQLMMALVELGAAVATRGSGPSAQEAGRLAQDVAALLNDVVASGYSQEQELEADQLGIRYCIRAGYDPQVALRLLDDFRRFENPWPFFRTHPYIQRRYEDLKRYLTETHHPAARSEEPDSRHVMDAHRKRLLEVQKLYPVGSQSWKNLQRQLDELEGSPPPPSHD